MDSDNVHWAKYYSAKIDPNQENICWAERPNGWPEHSRT